MNSPGVVVDVGGRRRLISASYEAGGAACKALLNQHTVAVFHDNHGREDIARMVAATQQSVEPFLMMDVSGVQERMHEWSMHLPHVMPFYPISCNDDPLLVQMITREGGCGLQVCNGAELSVALQYVEPHRIQLLAVFLTRGLVKMIASLGAPLHSVIVCSEGDVAQLTSALPTQPLLVRFTLNQHNAGEADDDEWGMDVEEEEKEDAFIENTIGLPLHHAAQLNKMITQCGANVVGISVQLADGVDGGALTDDDGMEKKARRCEALVRLIQTLTTSNDDGRWLSVVDVGGGQHAIPLPTTATLYSLIVDATHVSSIQMVASPGRFFATAVFSLITAVTGKQAVQMDTDTGYVYSTNVSVWDEMSGMMVGRGGAGGGAERPHCMPLLNGDEDRGRSTHKSAVLGHAATHVITDCLQACTMPSLNVGDRLLWNNIGAYGQESTPHGLPVYYFSDRNAWDRMQREDSCASLSSISGSSDDEEGEKAHMQRRQCEDELASDGETMMTEDEDDNNDDMAPMFHYIFNDDIY